MPRPYKVYNKCYDMFSLTGGGYSKLVWLQVAGGSNANEYEIDDCVDHIIKMSVATEKLREIVGGWEDCDKKAQVMEILDACRKPDFGDPLDFETKHV